MILSESQKFASPEEALEHFGIKGMKWGIRNQRAPVDLNLKTEGVTLRRDGSMDIEAGVNLQRLVRSNGQSLPMKGVTYASVNDYDNSRYIKVIGGKGILGGGRDRILTIQTTKPLKAPSVDEATRIVSDMIVNDATFRAKNTNILGAPIRSKEVEQIRKDPVGKTAQMWYRQTNQTLTYDPSFDKDAPYVQKTVRARMLDKGYNALRDENDVAAKYARAPIIIFKPETSLKVVGKRDIDDKLRKANKAKLKQYKRNGKDWVDSQLYDD